MFFFPGDNKELHRLCSDLLKRKTIKSIPLIRRTDELKIFFDRPPLGSGAFGKVYVAKLEGRQEPVCVKFINNYDNSKTKQRYLIKEASILWCLRTTECVPICFGIAKVAHKHPNTYLPHVIVQEIIKSGLKSPQTLTLEDLMKPENNLPKPNWSNLKERLFNRLTCVHQYGVVIGDISEVNIMVYWDGKHYIPYFIDMGSARYSRWIQRDIDRLENITKEFPKESQE